MVLELELHIVAQDIVVVGGLRNHLEEGQESHIAVGDIVVVAALRTAAEGVDIDPQEVVHMGAAGLEEHRIVAVVDIVVVAGHHTEVAVLAGELHIAAVEGSLVGEDTAGEEERRMVVVEEGIAVHTKD